MGREYPRQPGAQGPTYAQLDMATHAAAVQLRQLGIEPGDRVLLVAENCAAPAVLVLAASQCDAWAVVVNARLSAREIDTFIEHCGARRVLPRRCRRTQRRTRHAPVQRCPPGHATGNLLKHEIRQLALRCADARQVVL